MTTPTQEAHAVKAVSKRKLDVVSLILLLIGLACGVVSYWLITVVGFNALILVPSVVVATTGATHLTKLEAPRE